MLTWLLVPELVIRKDTDIGVSPDFPTSKPKLVEVPWIVQVHRTEQRAQTLAFDL